MPGCSSARRDDARVSATSSPARRSAASSSGRESGLRPGASNAPRTSATSASSLCGRAPRGGRGPSRSVSRRSWTSTRHGTPAYVISAATRAPADSAASSSPSRAASARCRHGGQLPGVLEVGAQVLGRVVDREQRRVGRRARPEPVPVLRLLTRQQPHVHRGRPPQQVVAQPQVVAALDPHARPPAAADTTARCRPTPSAARRPRALARTPAGRPAPARAPRRRRRPAPGRPAGARARPGSWGHPDTAGDEPVQLNLQGSPPLWVSASYSGADHAHTPCSLFATHRKTSNCLPS